MSDDESPDLSHRDIARLADEVSDEIVSARREDHGRTRPAGRRRPEHRSGRPVNEFAFIALLVLLCACLPQAQRKAHDAWRDFAPHGRIEVVWHQTRDAAADTWHKVMSTRGSV